MLACRIACQRTSIQALPILLRIQHQRHISIVSDSEKKKLMEPLLAKGWVMLEGEDAIQKKFRFDTFIEAFGLMTKIALYAEKVEHHPMFKNEYRNLQITLTTFDLKGLSTLDFDMAHFIEKSLGNYNKL